MTAAAEILVQVTAPHFCAGLVITDGICTEAAPILKWAIGQSDRDLSGYFKRRKWKAVIIALSCMS